MAQLGADSGTERQRQRTEQRHRSFDGLQPLPRRRARNGRQQPARVRMARPVEEFLDRRFTQTSLTNFERDSFAGQENRYQYEELSFLSDHCEMLGFGPSGISFAGDPSPHPQPGEGEISAHKKNRESVFGRKRFEQPWTGILD